VQITATDGEIGALASHSVASGVAPTKGCPHASAATISIWPPAASPDSSNKIAPAAGEGRDRIADEAIPTRCGQVVWENHAAIVRAMDRAEGSEFNEIPSASRFPDAAYSRSRYHDEARRSQAAGKVTCKVVVGAHGRASQIRVSRESVWRPMNAPSRQFRGWKFGRA